MLKATVASLLGCGMGGVAIMTVDSPSPGGLAGAAAGGGAAWRPDGTLAAGFCGAGLGAAGGVSDTALN